VVFGGVPSFAGTANVVRNLPIAAEAAAVQACFVFCVVFYYEMSCIKFPVS
jgi:hypothetical protein